MRKILALLLLSLLSLIPSAANDPADLILKNATFYTLDNHHPNVEAVAIRDGCILKVGTLEDVSTTAGTATRIVDLHGAFAYPGFVDAHAHVYGLGKSLEILDLTGMSSEAAIVEKVRQAVGHTPAGRWIQGRGWDQNLWAVKSFPDARKLSQAAPDNPVMLTRVDGHAVWVNHKAMEIAGIAAPVPDVEGGEILVDAQGNPNGVFVDNAISLVSRHIPEPGPDVLRRRLELAMNRAAHVGLTEIHDAGVGPDLLKIYQQIRDRHKLPVRIWVMLESDLPWLEEILPKGIQADSQGMLTVRSVKLFADGALGSRGAWLLEPYTDRPDTRGLPTTPPETLERIASLCVRYGFQACTHAIGDRANREMLDIYAKVLATVPDGRERRFRIEHAQILALNDILRFHQLGVIPSMQPTHCTSDMGWAEQRLGHDRCRGAYAWKSLLDDGNLIPMGSDFPVEHVNPLLGFYAAITRADHNGQPAGGWFPAQKMTRLQALKSMTEWAAYAAFQEKWKGRLSPGMWADITVCDRDIMTVPPRDILSTAIRMTLVGGRIVYQSDSTTKTGP